MRLKSKLCRCDTPLVAFVHTWTKRYDVRFFTYKLNDNVCTRTKSRQLFSKHIGYSTVRDLRFTYVAVDDLCGLILSKRPCNERILQQGNGISNTPTRGACSSNQQGYSSSQPVTRQRHSNPELRPANPRNRSLKATTKLVN